ncbi:Na+/H+ antiporter subunit E [Dietzia sp. CQ4]|uniref:Na+/H+ antiporter subunit E n=1 Tax=Dietzia sp. (strain CQ4) TaxID=370437 RepID=UPI0015FE580E|nr:Na+/H+ antiporter subunit E [Dietzia sp. CQ4]MBB1035204.1 Na+/H+ antiporter subunit E [Dietzia sp. CQ4]
MIGYVRAAVVRFLVLLLLWWILAEGDTRFWHYGLVATAVATAVSLRALPPARPRTGRRPWEIPGLAGWFLLALLRGGIDVARRALDPRMPISPHTRRLPIRSGAPAARRLALWMINLMPGTLVSDEGEDWVDLHVLAEDIDADQAWAGLERRLGRIIGT